MHALASGPPPSSEHRWAYQPCWHGQRALIHLHGALSNLGIYPPVRVLDPNGRDLTEALPELSVMADAGGTQAAIIDVVITTPPEPGLSPAFARSRLTYRLEAIGLAAAAERAVDQPITVLVLDLLHLSGRRVGDLPYTHRRSLLLERLPDGPHWEVPSHSLRPDRHLLAAAREWHTDDVIAKRLDSHYFPALQSPTWLRIPARQFAEPLDDPVIY